MDVITGATCTPFFLLLPIFFLPTDLSEGKQVCFVSYTGRTFPWTIFRPCDANLYSTAFCGSTFFHCVNSKHFRWLLRSERGKFSREKWCSIFWTALHRDQNSFCKGFDLPGYYSGYRLCEFWTQMTAHCLDCKSCQPQQPNRPTIRLDFPPIWLRDAERYAVVLPIFSVVHESCKPTATRRMNPQGWTSKHPGLGKQAKSKAYRVGPARALVAVGNHRVLWHLASNHFVSTFDNDGIMAHPMHRR